MRFFEAKSYELHETSNPLFPRKEAPKKRWPWIVAILVLMVVITAVAGVIYGPYFEIRHIEVQGTVTIAPEDISNKLKEQFEFKRWLVLPNSHQWFFDTDSAEAMLQNNFPLKTVVIEKVGPTLRVTVVEDIFMVALRSGEPVYFLDPSGKVLRLAEPNEAAEVISRAGATAPSTTDAVALNTDMPIIREKIATEHAPNDQLFNDAMIDHIIQFSEGLRAMNIQPLEFVSDDPALPWFTVTSNLSYVILFDATQDVSTQLEVFRAVSTDIIDAESTPRYVDVRFGTRVFIR